METIKELFDQAWKAVISPNKYVYNINTICPKQQLFNNKIIQRIQFNVSNDHGKNITVIIVKQKNIVLTDAIIYFHGNGGTKVQILGILPLIAEQNIAVISFDCIGCGNSDDGYLTYGVQQSLDA